MTLKVCSGSRSVLSTTHLRPKPSSVLQFLASILRFQRSPAFSLNKSLVIFFYFVHPLTCISWVRASCMMVTLSTCQPHPLTSCNFSDSLDLVGLNGYPGFPDNSTNYVFFIFRKNHISINVIFLRWHDINEGRGWACCSGMMT